MVFRTFKTWGSREAYSLHNFLVAFVHLDCRNRLAAGRDEQLFQAAVSRVTHSAEFRRSVQVPPPTLSHGADYNDHRCWMKQRHTNQQNCRIETKMLNDGRIKPGCCRHLKRKNLTYMCKRCKKPGVVHIFPRLHESLANVGSRSI